MKPFWIQGVYYSITFDNNEMKSFIILFIAGVALLIMSSCSGSHKACAAYAKHDVEKQDTTPRAAASFKDLQ